MGTIPYALQRGDRGKQWHHQALECAGIDEIGLIATNEGPFVQLETLGVRLLGLIAGGVAVLDLFECSFERLFRNPVGQLEVEMLA